MNFKELGENLGLDEDEYRELVELFVETGTADFHRLQAAHKTNDMQQILQSAHTIKGASGNLGLIDVHEVAKQIENEAEHNNMDGVAKGLETLKDLFESIEEFIN